MRALWLVFIIASFGCSYFETQPVVNPQFMEKQYQVSLRIETVKRNPPLIIDIADNGFNDDFIQIKWIPTWEGFGFIMKNVTNDTINIIWDEILFVNESNKTSPIMHSGIRYMEKEGIQKPTPIASGTEINETIVPTDYVYYDSGSYDRLTRSSTPAGWKTNPLFYDRISESQKEEVQDKKYRIIFVLSKAKYDITFGIILKPYEK